MISYEEQKKTRSFSTALIFYPGYIRTGDPQLFGDFPLRVFLAAIKSIPHF